MVNARPPAEIAAPDRSGKDGPELTPSPLFGSAEYVVSVNRMAQCDNRLVMYSAFSSAASRLAPIDANVRPANVIRTLDGHLAWEALAPDGMYVFDLRKQYFRGAPVLTWWEGRVIADTCGDGRFVIADESYRVLRTVRADPPAFTSLHEFTITDAGLALFIVLEVAGVNTAETAGSEARQVYSPTAVVYDLNTDQRLFEWRAADHTVLEDSYQSAESGGIVDPYHMNSLDLSNNRLLVSLRGMSSVHCIDLKSGETQWRLGGKRPTISLGDGCAPCFQHDVRFTTEPGVIRLFNNNSNYQVTHGYSEILWIRVDDAIHKATVSKRLRHPYRLISGFLGNSTEDPDGSLFGSWGSAGHLYGVDRTGKLLYDAHLAVGPYRAYLDDWCGMPDAPPELIREGSQLNVTWNGATRVQGWRLMAGPRLDSLVPHTVVPWTGYRQSMALPAPPCQCCLVEAIGEDGVLGQSNHLDLR